MLAVTFPEVTALISAIAWPLVVCGVLLAYRRHLPALVDRLAGRVSRVSVAGVSIDLESAAEAKPAVVAEVASFIDATSSSGFRDSSASLQEVARTGNADYATIDLRGGHAWLTSRLFIFSIILANTAGVKRMLFVRRSAAGNETFVGISDPLEVASRLAHRFRWLPQGLADAEASPRLATLGAPGMSASPGELWGSQFADPEWAASVAELYLTHPLIRRAPYPPSAGLIAEFHYIDDAPALHDDEAAVAHTASQDTAPPAPDASPSLLGINPPSGSPSGGTLVTIAGAGLSGTTAVWFGGVNAPISGQVSDSTVTVSSPPGVGVVQVTLTPAAPPSQLAPPGVNEFAYTSVALPMVSFVDPASGPRTGGTELTLTGVGFTDVKQIRFGSADASIGSTTDTLLKTIAPAGAGSVPVTVVTPYGSSTTTDDWVSIRSSNGQLHAEHAAWIRDGEHLLALVGDALDRTRIVETTSTKPAELQAEILHSQGDFALIVDRDDQFRRLIDRRAAVQQIIAVTNK